MRTWLTLGVVSVALAACGGTGDSNATTTTSTPPTASTTTSTPSTTSTSTSTTSTSTTIAPTTTIPLIDEIQTAMDDFLAGTLRCGETPARCDVSFLADGSPIQERGRQLAEDRAGADQYYASDSRGTYIRVEDVAKRTDTDVLATTCWFDAIVILGPPGSDGLPTTVDDRAISSRKQHSLVREDGEWKVAEQAEIAELGEGDLCGGR